jgi:hypothetical protein
MAIGFPRPMTVRSDELAICSSVPFWIRRGEQGGRVEHGARGRVETGSGAEYAVPAAEVKLAAALARGRAEKWRAHRTRCRSPGLPLREKREAPSFPLGASARHAMEYGA